MSKLKAVSMLGLVAVLMVGFWHSIDNMPILKDLVANAVVAVTPGSGGGKSCTLDGVTLKDGQSRVFYRKSVVPTGWQQTCEPYGKKRTCSDGRLSGGLPYMVTGEYFNKANCAVPTVVPAGDIGRSREWELVFNDEFARKSSNWEAAENGKAWIGGYRFPQRAVVKSGFMNINNIKGNKKPYPTATTTSAVSGVTIVPSSWESAHMQSKRDFTYGFFEARIKISPGYAIDNAFWLMMDGGGPEIDIVEAFRRLPAEPDIISMSLRARAPHTNTVLKTDNKILRPTVDLSQGFHTYGVFWRPDVIVFYFDGVEQYRVTDEQSLAYFRDQPLRIRLSTAAADLFGTYGYTVPQSSHKTAMQIDYVRVFEPVNP